MGEEGEGDPLHPKSSANVKWAKQSERRRAGGDRGEDDGVSLRLTSASSGLLSERIRLVTCQGSLPPVMMFHNISSMQREHKKSTLFISVSNHVLSSHPTRGFTESPKFLTAVWEHKDEVGVFPDKSLQRDSQMEHSCTRVALNFKVLPLYWRGLVL